MKKLFPVMYDIPDRTLSMAGLFFGVICFYTFPFLALFFSGGFIDAASQSWFEFIYHGVNFFIVLWLFRHYLKDSVFNVQCDVKQFLGVVFGCAGTMIIYSVILFEVAASGPSERLFFAANGTLPMVEMELFNLTTNLIVVNPIGGWISILVFAPVTMSCVYYASAFAPFCANRPWLAYLMMAVILAIPRALNALTFWPLEEEVILYFAQLPLHMVACYAYQKADTVWAPIAVHAVANLAFGLLFHLILFIA